MPVTRRSAAALLTACLLLAPTGIAWAQQPGAAALNSQRNCQTIRNCQFTKGGSFRGCVSSYSCRACRFEPSRCSIGTASAVCRKLVCDWGG
jgi:hypothetical protein